MNTMLQRLILPCGALALLVGIGGATVPAEAGHAPSAEAAQVAQEKDKHPDVDFTRSCTDCHSRRVVRAWEENVHGQVNVGCFVCHGDGEVEFYRTPPTETCMGCHADRALEVEPIPGKGCFGCHDGHTLKFHK